MTLMEVRKEFLLLFVFYLVPTDLSMYIFHCWALLVCDMQKNLRFSNMSTFTQEFEQVEEEELPNTILWQGSNGSTTLGDGTNGFTPNPRRLKKKRSHPGNPDPNAEVIALSPRTLMATNTYVCEVCHKGFQRDQNLQLHRRGHNLPWKLKQKQSMEVRKRVYICPEKSCIHHALNRALGDLTGIKKHFFRKHGEKKWKCDKCSKRYAVHSDWKAHLKICGTKEYRCDCGTIFSRKDSFVTHRAFCDALTEENYKVSHTLVSVGGMLQSQTQELFSSSVLVPNSCPNMDTMMSRAISKQNANAPIRLFSLGSSGVTFSSCSDDVFDPNMPKALSVGLHCPSGSFDNHTVTSSSCMSATALLQKAAEMGAKVSDNLFCQISPKGFTGYSSSTMSSKGSALEASSVIDHTTNSDPYVRNENLIEHILEESRSMSVMPGAAVLQGGFMDFPEHSNIGETSWV